MIRALFVDLDGTLLDSVGLLQSAYCQFLRSAGAVPSDLEFSELNGPTIPQIVSILKRRHRLSEPEEVLIERYFSLLEDKYSSASEHPGASELLGAAKNRDIPIALVTSCAPRLYKPALKHLCWTPFFETIVSPENDEPSKPHPAIYLRAIKEMRVSANEKLQCLAIEDSRAGILAAVSAGLSVIAVAPGSDSASLMEVGARAVFARLTDAWRSSLSG